MPSATTADSNDSIAPSKAMARPSGKTACTFSMLKAGSAGDGSERGIAPKRVLTVCTSRWKTAHTTAARATAIRKDGQAGRSRRNTTIPARDRSVMPTVGKCIVGKASRIAMSVGKSADGSCAIVSPKRLRSWLAKMMTAMPAVNPTVTGKGMYLI
jgi:hypothetical protein